MTFMLMWGSLRKLSCWLSPYECYYMGEAQNGLVVIYNIMGMESTGDLSG